MLTPEPSHVHHWPPLPHGRVGWYIRPAPEHYSCQHIYFSETIVEWVALKWIFPDKTPF